jgi:hypothetical protein
VSTPRTVLSTILKLGLASLAVGLVLSFLGVTPEDLLRRATGLLQGGWEAARGFLAWAGGYILLGALVVVPLWALARLIGKGDGGIKK